MISFLKNKNNTVDNAVQKPVTHNEVLDNHDILLKYNQERIINKLGSKIEEAGFVSESLIDVVSTIEQYVEYQMDSIDRVVDEISSYSALVRKI